MASTAMALALGSGAALADPPLVANGVDLGMHANPVIAVTAGQRAVEVHNRGGGVTLLGGAISATSTAAAPAIGLLAHSGGVINSAANVTTSGSLGHAVQAGASAATATIYDGATAGTVNLTGGTIATSGAHAVALHALDAGVINAAQISVSTTGANGFGAHAESRSAIHLNGVTIATADSFATGLLADNDRRKQGVDLATPGGTIVAANVTLRTEGTQAAAALATHGAHIGIDGGQFTTTGADAVGLAAMMAGTIASSGDIQTYGVRAHAVVAGAADASDPGDAYDGRSAGAVTLSGGAIGATGQGAIGLLARDGGAIHVSDTQVAASGADSHVVVVDSNSAINLSGGAFAASGVGGHGLVARHGRRLLDAAAISGVIQSNGATITATGAGGHGALASDGGRIVLISGAVGASGAGGAGVQAVAHGQLSSTAAITASGAQGVGAAALDGGRVNLAGGSVTTGGDDGHGLLAARSGEITSASTITTHGARAHGAQAGIAASSAATYDGASAGVVRLNGGGVATQGAGAIGLFATDSGVIHASGAAVTAAAANAHGAFADSNSAIHISGGSISASGAAGHGVVADHGRRAVMSSALAGRVTLDAASIAATGAGGHAVAASRGGVVSMSGGDATVSGAGGAALFASDGGFITSSARLLASGAATSAAVASGGGISLAGGEVRKTGDDGFGLQARDGGAIDSAVAVSTTGARAHAVRAGGAGALDAIYGGASAGVVRLRAGQISAAGAGAAGLQAVDQGRIEAGAVAIATSGDGGHGGHAESASQIIFAGADITTSGAGAHGLHASNARRAAGIDATVAGGHISGRVGVTTTGAGAHAAAAADGGRIDLADSALTARGAGGASLSLSDGGGASITRSSVTAAQGAAIQIHNSASLSMTRATARGASAGVAASFSKADQRVDVLLSSGATLSADSGVLAAVDRSGAAAGSGMVHLTLGQGAEALGDILDTGPRTTGFTDVTLVGDAMWRGVMKGVRNVSAREAGARLHFADGTEITGDINASGAQLSFATGEVNIFGQVHLTNGATTRGGHIAAPIEVGGQMTVDASSHMGGNWRIGGNLTSRGAISPGQSVGVIHVGGDLNLFSTSVYHVEVTPMGLNDQILVAGRASLGGGVQVSTIPVSNGFRLGQPYTIVSAAGGINSSRFVGAAWADPDSYRFLQPVITYDANNAYLTVLRSDTGVGTVGENPNQAGAGRAIDRLPIDDGLFARVATLPSDDAARRALAALAGDAYPSIAAALAESSGFVRDSILERLDQAASFGDGDHDRRSRAAWAFGPRSYAPRGLSLTLWGHVLGGWGQAGDRPQGVATSRRSTAGFLTGVDAGVGDHWRIGLASGYARTRINVRERLTDGSANSYHAAAYGAGTWGDVSLRLGAAYSWIDLSTRRTVVFSGFGEALGASGRSGIAQLFGEASYRARLGDASLEPYLALAYIGAGGQRLQESGGLAALLVNQSRINVSFSTLGARLSQVLTFANGDAVTARAALGWRHAFGDVQPRSLMALAGDPLGFLVNGAPIARDALVAQAGADWALAANVSLGVSWTGQMAAKTQDQTLRGAFAVRF